MPKLQANIVVETDMKKLTTASGAMSSRRPVWFVGPDGNTVKGYFTKNTVNRNVRNRFKEVIAEKKEKYPQYAPLFDALEDVSADTLVKRVLQGGEDHSVKFANPASGKYVKIDVFANWNNSVRTDAAREYILQNYDNPQFEDMLFDVTEKLMGEYVAEETATYSGQARDRNINRRNNAMSEVAELLNCGDLIAKSCNMTLLDGKQMSSGTFMFNAQGYDYDHLNPHTHKELAGRTMSLGAQAKKKISDLQVIDYLCGNVDRHSGNFFYQFDLSKNGEMMLVGVQGIDNDLSFVNTSKNKNKQHMADVMQFGRISRSMADALTGMNKDAFEMIMRNAGIAEDEVQSGLERLDALRKGIASSKLKIVEDADWGKPENKFQELVKTGKTFSKVNSTMSDWNRIIMPSTADDLRRIDPARFAVQKPLEVGMSKTEMDKFNLLENVSRLSEIKNQLTAKTPASHTNGAEYEKMIAALDKVISISTDLASDFDGKSGVLPDMKYNKLSMAYKTLEKRSQEYVDSHTGYRRSMGKFRVEKANELRTLSVNCRHAAMENSVEALNEQMKAEAEFIKNGGRAATIRKLAEQLPDPFKDIEKIEKNVAKKIGKLQKEHDQSRQANIKVKKQMEMENARQTAESQKLKKFSKLLAIRLSAEIINTADTMTAKTANYYSNPDVINQAAANIYGSKGFKDWAKKEFTQEYIDKLKADPGKLRKEADKVLDTLGLKPQTTISKVKKTLAEDKPEIKQEAIEKSKNSMLI